MTRDFVVCDMCEAPCSPCVWINLVELCGFDQGLEIVMAFLPLRDAANNQFCIYGQPPPTGLLLGTNTSKAV